MRPGRKLSRLSHDRRGAPVKFPDAYKGKVLLLDFGDVVRPRSRELPNVVRRIRSTIHKD